MNLSAQILIAILRFILGSALKSKKSAKVSKRFLAILFAWRFVVVPALSIGAVWGVSKLSSNIIVRSVSTARTLRDHQLTGRRCL